MFPLHYDTLFYTLLRRLSFKLARLGIEPKLTVHETVVLTTTQSRFIIIIFINYLRLRRLALIQAFPVK